MRIFWQSFVDASVTREAYMARALVGHLKHRGTSARSSRRGHFAAPTGSSDGLAGQFALRRPGDRQRHRGGGGGSTPPSMDISSIPALPVAFDARHSCDRDRRGDIAGGLSTQPEAHGLVTLDPVFEVWHYEQAERYGLGDRVVHVTGSGCKPADFADAFDGDQAAQARMIKDFVACARPLIEHGADVVIPAGVLPGLLIGREHGLKVGHAPSW